MNLPLSSNNENFDYNWQWAYKASEKTLKEALNKDREKVISQLGQQLLKQDSVVNLELAYKVISCLTDQHLESASLQEFFKILSSTHALDRDLRESKDTGYHFLFSSFFSKSNPSAHISNNKNALMTKVCYEAIQNGDENLAIEAIKQIEPHNGIFNGIYQNANLFSLAKEQGFDQLMTEMVKAMVNSCEEEIGLNTEHLYTLDIEVLAQFLKFAIHQNPEAAQQFISNYPDVDKVDMNHVYKMTLIALKLDPTIPPEVLNKSIRHIPSIPLKMNLFFTAFRENPSIRNSDLDTVLKNFNLSTDDLATNLNAETVPDPDLRKELVALLAEKKGLLVIQNMNKYDIRDIASRIEIAKITAKTHPIETLKNFSNFEIQNDEKSYYEIASIAIKENFNSCNHLMKISNPRQIDLFFLACKEHPEQFSEPRKLQGLIKQFNLSFYMNKVLIKYLPSILEEGLQGEAAKIKIAKNEAKTNPNELVRFFKEYNITDESAGLEIFQIAAEVDLIQAFNFVENFNFKNYPPFQEFERDSLEKVYRQSKADNFSMIPSMVRNKGFLIDLFFLARKNNPEEFASNLPLMLYKFNVYIFTEPLLASLQSIDEKGLTGEAARIEIAKNAARADVLKIDYFYEYQIIDEDALFSIAEILFKQNPNSVLGINLFKIANQEKKLELFLLAFSLNSKVKNPDNVKTYLPPELYNGFKEINKNDSWITPDLPAALHHLENYYASQMKSQQIDKIFTEIKESSNPIVQEALLKFLFYIFASSFNTENEIFNDDLVNVILNFRDPEMRYILIHELKLMHKEPLFYQAHVSENDDSYVKLSHLFLNNLQLQSENKEEWSVISKKIKKAKLIFKDANSSKTLMQTLSLISRSETLSIDDKLNLLNLVFENENKKDILDKLYSIQSIFQWKAVNRLKQTEQPLDLKAINEEFFFNNVPMSDKEKYVKNFEKIPVEFRDALAVYTSKLNQTFSFDSRLKLLLGEFCDSLVSEDQASFRMLRYDVEENPHLRTIFDAQPDLKEEWQTGHSFPLSSLVLEKGKFSGDNFLDFFEKAFNSGNLSEKDYPFLKEYLDNCGTEPQKVNVLDQRLNSIYAQLKKRAKEKDLSIDEQNRLNFQIELIPLLNPKLDPKRKERILVNVSNNYLKVKSRKDRETQPKIINDEFLKDIEKMLEAFKKGSSYQGWTVKNSDDPRDLFLSGTEIDGSCLNVSGSPVKNKCLLNYTLDGKNRIVIVTDENGIIKARCLLRLYWDPNKKVAVLFQEEGYFKGAKFPLMQKALDLMCEETAKRMGLDLLSKNQTDSPYPVAIASLESKVPFDYVDALREVTDGPYVIKETYLQTPA